MSKSQKYILSAVGITGVSLVAWRVLFPWLQYDIKTIRTIRRVAALIEQDLTNKRTIIDKFEEVVSRRPWHSFIIFEDHYYTYGFTDQMANRVANFALSLGLQAGDVVAIMMKNEPRFIWTFLGKTLAFQQKCTTQLYFGNFNRNNRNVEKMYGFEEV